jgi:hypothetical protein
MEVKVTYRSGVQFEAEARGHRIICDQPADAGGEDAGMTPPEFLLPPWVRARCIMRRIICECISCRRTG